MGIIERLRTVVASNINALISKAEDPEKMLEQLVLDMQQQFTQARMQVAKAMADGKRLEKQYENEVRISKEWEARARKALMAQDENLAREALARKGEHDKMAAEYKVQVDAQNQATESLRAALQQLGNKIEEAKRKKNLLIARSKRAKAQKTIHETMAGLSENSAFDAFARLEGKVDQIEAEAEVATELAGELTAGDELEQKFKALDSQIIDTDADLALDALKASMGMLPAPAPANALLEPSED